MAKKASGPVDPLKAKEAKQKKIAIGGAVLLVILLVIQGPKLMKQLHQSSAPPPPPPASATTPVGTPAVTTTPTFTPAAPTDGSSSSGLLSSAPTAAIGQLSSFGTFVGKDPFASQVPAGGSASAPSGGKTTPKTPPKPPTPPAPPTTTAPAANPTSAVISVNGAQESVAVGADFPAKQPFFHLLSLTQHTAKISIAGGSLASGAGSITLQEKKPLTLQNTSDGTRYTIELFPQGTAVTQTGTTSGASAVPPPGTTTSSTTTTASTTTTTG